MEVKIFGKKLFEVNSNKSELLWMDAQPSAQPESKFLPDFYKNFSNRDALDSLSSYVVMADSNGEAVAIKQGEEKNKEHEIVVTPKGIHHLKLLNDEQFVMNIDPEYIDQQLLDFKDKLGMIKSAEYDMRRGVGEISSMILRLENRKKYGEYKDFFDQFPYTKTSRINAVVKAHDNLKVGQIEQFIADMPKEAVDTMKQYNEEVAKVCGKQAVYYLIADKKDFKKTDGRRDPILLAQSPFGHFWQILGAWDDEMLFLEEL